jgi:hypothetical protein
LLSLEEGAGAGDEPVVLKFKLVVLQMPGQVGSVLKSHASRGSSMQSISIGQIKRSGPAQNNRSVILSNEFGLNERFWSVVLQKPKQLGSVWKLQPFTGSAMHARPLGQAEAAAADEDEDEDDEDDEEEEEEEEEAGPGHNKTFSNVAFHTCVV